MERDCSCRFTNACRGDFSVASGCLGEITRWSGENGGLSVCAGPARP